MLSVDNACCLRVVTQECCLLAMLVTEGWFYTRMLSRTERDWFIQGCNYKH